MHKTNAVEKDLRSTFKELPYFNFTGILADYHGQTNNSVLSFSKSKRNLDRLPSLHNLDLFSLNNDFNSNLNPDKNLPNQRIYSRYFSPNSFKIFNNKLSITEINSSSWYH